MTELRHPGAVRLRAAMEASDHAALMETLAEDVVLRSPIVDVAFEGREEAGELFAVLLEVFEEISYVVDLTADDLHVFAFRLKIRGRPVEGVDLVRFNDQNEVSEITVFFRPLSGIAEFIAATGPKVAKRLDGSPAAVRATTPPVTAMMKLAGRLAPRLLNMRRARG